jgi:ATP-binding cassette subfamily B protein
LLSVLAPHARRLWPAVAAVLLQQAAALSGPVLVAIMIDRAIPALRAGDARPLVVVAVAQAGCGLAAGLLQSLFIRLSVRVGQDVVADLRMRLFSHLQAQSVEFHDRHAAGALASRASGDIDAVRSLFDSGIDQIATAAVSLAYTSSILLVLDWRLGCAALAAMGPIHWTMRSFRGRSLPVYQRRSAAAAAASAHLSETLAGIRTVRAFGLEGRNEHRFARLNRRHREENRRTQLEMARYVASSRLVAGTAVAALVLWGRTGSRPARWGWAPTPESCCTCGISTTSRSGSAASSTPTSRPWRRWARSPCCWPSNPPSRSPPLPPACPRLPGSAPDAGWRSPASRSPTATDARCCAASTSTSPPGRPSR